MTSESTTSEAHSSRAAVGVEVEQLRVSFGDTEVLHGVNFEVQPEEIFVIMGPSGSGKSVMLRAIMGLLEPSAGEVRIDGRKATDPETRQAIAAALVFQAGALFNSMTVYDNLAFYPREHRLYNERQIRDRVCEALRMLSLEHAANFIPAELSGGMKKRVAVARAIVMEPQLILYDEPTSELDPIMGATISEMIAALRQETRITSVVVSHDRDLAFSIADRVAVLMDGDLITVDTPQNLKENSDPRLREFLSPKIDLEHPRFRKGDKR